MFGFGPLPGRSWGTSLNAPLSQLGDVLGLGCLVLDSWSWIPGHGFLVMDSLSWIPCLKWAQACQHACAREPRGGHGGSADGREAACPCPGHFPNPPTPEQARDHYGIRVAQSAPSAHQPTRGHSRMHIGNGATSTSASDLRARCKPVARLASVMPHVALQVGWAYRRLP